jgi:hypothetical protein
MMPMKLARGRLPMYVPELEVAMEVALVVKSALVVVGLNVGCADGSGRVDVVILLTSSSLSALVAPA